jgi:CPA2 family monovalent cation:H+ antiporter-2
VGEFSFVLLRTGQDAGLEPAGLGADGEQIFLSITVLLMVCTPALAWAGDRLAAPNDSSRAVGRTPAGQGPGTTSAARSSSRDHVVILGWGQDSLELAEELLTDGHDVVLTTLNPVGAQAAERIGVTVVRGDSTRYQILQEADVAQARLVVVAEDDPEQTERIAQSVRTVSSAPVLVRPRGEPDLERLADAGVAHVVDADSVARRLLIATVRRTLGESAPDAATPPQASVDTTQLTAYRWPGETGCAHADDSHAVLPRSAGCAECLRAGTSWVHLRLCLSCGHVGCCDSSPGRHARAHHATLGHPLIASAEPGESWAYCFLDDTTVATSAGDSSSPASP